MALTMEEIIDRNGGIVLGIINEDEGRYLFKCKDNRHAYFVSTRKYIEGCYIFCPMCTKNQMEKYVKYSLYLIFNKKYEFSCRKPPWLTEDLPGCHIDMYCDEIKFALEVDGLSHALDSYFVILNAKIGIFYNPLETDKKKDLLAKEHHINVLRFKYNNNRIKPKTYHQIKEQLYDLVSAEYSNTHQLLSKEEFLTTTYTVEDAKDYYYDCRYNEAAQHTALKGATLKDFKYGLRKAKCIEVECPNQDCSRSKYWSFDDIVRTDDNARKLYCETCAPTTVVESDIKDFIEDRLHKYVSQEHIQTDRIRRYVSFICGVCSNTHKQLWDNLRRRLTYRCPYSSESQGNRLSEEERYANQNKIPSCISVIKRHPSITRVSEFLCTNTGMTFNTTEQSLYADKDDQLRCIACGLHTYIETIKRHDSTLTVTCLEDFMQYSYGDVGVALKYGHNWPFNCSKCNETYYVRKFSLIQNNDHIHECLRDIVREAKAPNPKAKEIEKRYRDKEAKKRDIVQKVEDYCLKMGALEKSFNKDKSQVTIKCNHGHAPFTASTDSLLRNKTWCTICNKNYFKKSIAFCVYNLIGADLHQKRIKSIHTLEDEDLCISFINNDTSDKDVSTDKNHIRLVYKRPRISDKLKRKLYDTIDDMYEDLHMSKDDFISMPIDPSMVYNNHKKAKEITIAHMLSRKGSILVAPEDDHGLITAKCTKCKTNNGRWNYHDIMSSQKRLRCVMCKPHIITPEYVQMELDKYNHKLVHLIKKETEYHASFICSICNKEHEYSHKTIQHAYMNGSQNKLCADDKSRKGTVDIMSRMSPEIAHVTAIDNGTIISKPSNLLCTLTGTKYKVDKLEYLIGKEASGTKPTCMACVIDKYMRGSNNTLTLKTDLTKGVKRSDHIEFHCNKCNTTYREKITQDVFAKAKYHRCQ